MKTFNYRVMARQDPDGDIYFQIYTVFYLDDVPKSYTESPSWVIGETISEIQDELEQMKRATLKPILWYGERFPEEYDG